MESGFRGKPAVSTLRSAFLMLWLLVPAAARAEDAPQPLLAIPDAVYKGVVGKALDVVPMDPEHRATLQRTNAVLSSTMTARTLSVWVGLGLSNPVLLIGGLIWGIYAASNIKPDPGKPKPHAALVDARVDAVRYQFIPPNDTRPHDVPAEAAAQGDE